MLASPSSEAELDALQVTGDYLFECKYDGIRCLAHLGSDKIVLRTRAGKDITPQFPDILERLRPIQESAPNTVLDGEIIVYENDKELLSAPSFQRLQTRIQRKTNIEDYVLEYPAHYKVFDVLRYRDVDQCNKPLVERRNLLRVLFARYHNAFAYSADSSKGRTLFEFGTKHGYEGIIAKLKTSTYIQGTRSNSWLKIKPTQCAIVEVIGMTRGTGRRARYFGALVTKEGLVGTGFTDTDLALITFTKIVWDNSIFRSFKIEVEFQERTKDGKMRFPSFCRIVNG